MLLRAGLIYVLAVFCLLLGTFSAWQRVELNAEAENYRAVAERATALLKENAELRLSEESTIRRALVAEDSLARRDAADAGDEQSKGEPSAGLADALGARVAAELARTKLEEELKSANKARDEAHKEADALRSERDEARKSAERALDAADKAKEELAAAKAQAAAQPAAASAQTRSTEPKPTDPPAAPAVSRAGETGSVREEARAGPPAVAAPSPPAPVTVTIEPDPAATAKETVKEAAVAPAEPATRPQPQNPNAAPAAGDALPWAGTTTTPPKPAAKRADSSAPKPKPAAKSAQKKIAKPQPSGEGSTFYPF